MKRLALILGVLACVAGCRQTHLTPRQSGDAWEAATKGKRVSYTFEDFIALPGYRNSRDYWRGAALEQHDPAHSRVEILLNEQRGRLYIREQIAMDFPICSGRVGGMETPRGTFRITEKKREKRSTSYGTYVNAAGDFVSGGAVSWRKGPAGTHFQGASMPYWMRFNGAVGMHVGKVLRETDSHGCVRIPEEACSILFDKLAVGSKVTVR